MQNDMSIMPMSKRLSVSQSEATSNILEWGGIGQFDPLDLHDPRPPCKFTESNFKTKSWASRRDELQ